MKYLKNFKCKQMRRISFKKQGHSDSKMNIFKSKCFLIELELAINVKDQFT